MQKKAYSIGKPDFPERKTKDVKTNVLRFKMEAIVHRSLRLEKLVKKVEKSSFLQKRDIRIHHLPLCLWKATLSDNLIHVFYPYD